MKKFWAIALSVGIALSTSSCGKSKQGSPNDFAIVNDLGSSLSEVYISESANEDWGSNLLGTTAFENGKKLDITFSGAPTATSVFDIAVLTAAGTEYQFKSIDLNTSNVVTLTMQDGAAVAAIQ